MANTSNCLQLIDRMPQQDQDAILARLEALQAQGLSPKEAQLQAAIDVLAQVEAEGASSSGDVTETPAFKRWFGDSKVVDADGKPLVVYHGTLGDFDVFGAGGLRRTKGGRKGAFYFATSEEQASAYAGTATGRQYNNETGAYGPVSYGMEAGGNVVPAYLSIRNPLVFDAQGRGYEQVENDAFAAASAGDHDGILFRNMGDSPGAQGSTRAYLEDVWVAFSPTQIKSATGNNGNFDPANPDIRKSVDRDANFKRWTRGLPVIEADFSGTYDGGPAVFQAYHGTTHTDITEFKNIGSKEGALGQGPYFSTSVNDVNENYAGVGPDLTNRIGREEDNVRDGFYDDPWFATEVLDDYFASEGIDQEVTDDNIDELKDEHGDKAITHAATKRLKGASEGLVMPVYVRLERPFNMATNPTYFEMTFPVNEDGEPDYEAEPEGSAIDLINAINEVASGYNADADSLTSWVYENGTDGISAREVWDRASKDMIDLYDDNGEMISSGQFMQEVAREMGFDGLIQDADLYFGTQRRGFGGIRAGAMKGVEPGTLHIMPFDGSQVKSATGNSGEFGENREILKSVDRPQFYSQLQRAIEQVPARLDNMGAAAWKQWLTANAPKLGVKAEEVEWSGIKDYLDLQGKKKLGKDELAAYLDDSGVKVSEVTLGNVETGTELDEWLDKWTDTHTGETADAIQNGQSWEYILKLAKRENHKDVVDRMTAKLDTQPPKYSQYTLPGGENYRELLITLPGGQKQYAYDAFNPRTQQSKSFSTRAEAEAFANQDPTGNTVVSEVEVGTPDYKSSHWDEANVLAHIRVNDRTAQEPGYVVRNTRSGNPSEVFASREQAEAYQSKLPASVKTEIVEQPRDVRVLFVEEVQSDWGQDGKKRGFKQDVDRAAIELRMQEITARLRQIAKSGVDESPEMQAEWNKLSDEKSRLTDSLVKANSGVPVAPFVTKTEGWLNLALKRIAMMAVEGGYDKVAFVNGEQSADRYDLSKQVDQIRYKKNGDGTFDVWASDRSGASLNDTVDKQGLSPAEIEDFVGKDVAQKIVGGEGRNEDGDMILEGVDLKVGGEGMKAFYDQIVPQALNKLLPKLGGEKLGAVNIGSMDTKQGRESDALLAELGVEVEGKRPPTQPGFDVTDKMRETVKKGVPLFSRDRQTQTPEFKKWFGDSKVVDVDGSPLVVYTGTSKDIDFKSFKIPKNGAWFTYDPKTASAYALENDSMDIKTTDYRTFTQVNTASRVIPAYLRIEKMYKPTESEMAAMVRASNYKREQGNLFDRVRREGFDGVDMGDGVYVVIGDATQIKSAIGNNGNFDGTNPDILKSPARPYFDDLAKLKVSTNYQLGDLFKTSRKLSWWDRTIGTQYNLAQKHPQFKRVFDAVQQFINDVSAFATRAADMAPSILPKLESWKDIARSPLSAADVQALRDPVFGGTLKYTRDENGELIETDDVQKAGVVFTDEELRSNFDLSDRQIGLYREFRKAVDQSVTDLALSDMIRYLGEDGVAIKEAVMGSGNVDVGSGIIESHLEEIALDEPARADVMRNTIDAIKEKADQANRLMDRGYAPLSRFGQYTVYAVAPDGEQLYFSMFENERDANRMKREMQEQYPDATVSTGTMSQESYKLFSGVTPETLALFGEALGLEESGIDTKSEAYQQMLKVAKTNRSAMRRLIERKGIDGFSEDAGRVLAGFVYSNARQIATNLHAGEIGKAAADIKDGDLKDAAINLMQYIQNPQEEAQALRGLMFTQFIGGSIASAMVNLTQPFTMTLPYLAQFAGATGAGKAMADAVKLASRGIRNDDDLKQMLKRAEDEGVVSPQEVHQLMAQAQGKGALQSGDGTKVGDALAKANNFKAKVSLGWGKLFGAAEQFNRRVTFIAAYKLAREKGMENPFQFAEQAIAETQGIYNKGNKPAWARGAVGGTLFTFKQYSIGYVEFLRRMWGTGPEGKKAVGLALGVLFLMSGAGGMPGADDLDDVIDGFAQRVLGRSFDSKQAKREFFASILGQAGAEFVMSGISGLPGMPIDVSGRMGLGNFVPGTGLLTKKRDYAQDYKEIVGPAGTLFTNAGTALASLAQGDVGKAAEVLSPVAIQNALKAKDMAAMGFYRDQKGRKVVDTDGYDVIFKAMGFQPRAVAQVQEATGTQANLIAQNKLRESEIADKWAAGRIERDPSKVEEAKQMLADWNAKNPGSPIKIDPAQINKRVQEANKSKAQRVAATAPKEIRGAVKKELQPVE